MAAFRQHATEDAIDRVVQGINIRHASATVPSDYKFVLAEVESSIGAETLNAFCQEIVRCALMEAAEIPVTTTGEDPMDAVLENLVARADQIAVARKLSGDASSTPTEVNIRRAAAMMRLRRKGNSVSVRNELGGVVHLARRYYGDQAQIVRDIQSALQKLASHRKRKYQV